MRSTADGLPVNCGRVHPQPYCLCRACETVLVTITVHMTKQEIRHELEVMKHQSNPSDSAIERFELGIRDAATRLALREKP